MSLGVLLALPSASWAAPPVEQHTVNTRSISRGGFTVVLSLGVGYAVTSRPIDSHVQVLAGFGLGFTSRVRYAAE